MKQDRQQPKFPDEDKSLKERYKDLYNLLKGTTSSNLKNVDLLKRVGVKEIYNLSPKAKAKKTCYCYQLSIKKMATRDLLVPNLHLF